MSNKALLANYMDDYLAPAKVYYHELEDGIVAVERRQDVEGLVELAKNLKDIPPGREFRLVGFIPDSVLDEALAQGWIHDKKRLKRWLNDPDNRKFRVWEGNV